MRLLPPGLGGQAPPGCGASVTLLAGPRWLASGGAATTGLGGCAFVLHPHDEVHVVDDDVVLVFVEGQVA